MPNINYNIRVPNHTDEWEAVKSLLVQYRDEFDDDICFPSFDQELAGIETFYSSEKHHLLLAQHKVDHEIVGCIAIHHFAVGISEMRRLYVKPSHRSTGLGKALVESIIALAAEYGYAKICLDTMHAMKAAQSLYLRLGFDQIPPYNKQLPEKLICFEKSLKEK